MPKKNRLIPFKPKTRLSYTRGVLLNISQAVPSEVIDRTRQQVEQSGAVFDSVLKEFADYCVECGVERAALREQFVSYFGCYAAPPEPHKHATM